MSKEDQNWIRVRGLFPSLLTTLFIGLKLTEEINWDWIWVISPIIISAIITTLYDKINNTSL